ncbi:MAG: two-component system, cell cycle sensor histidine kinase and response regulator CckA [Gaiellaceae bacterium]|jgi:signal transduction histidine kinase|nr:two-component system, cell cycle sensor histidine kinase and response regulator CckA [Gaiellaceae bacterium]
MTLGRTARSRSGSLRLVAEIGSVLVVLALATAGILYLRHEEGAAQASRLEIQRLDARLHEHSALEWHAIADGQLSEDVSKPANEIDGQIRRSLASLLHGGVPRNPAALSRNVDAYLDAAAREFTLVESGYIEAARELDETKVDPSFESVETLVAANDQALGEHASASSRNADVGSIGIAVASLLALLFLGGRILRAEKATAREAALATAQAELQDDLRHAQKMEAVGLLAGGIAHDFNNLLTIVSGYGELVVHDLGPGHACQDSMSTVLRAADRASDLTRQLLAFGGKQVMAPTELELGSVCENVRELLAGAVGANVALTLQVLERVNVLVDGNQTEQVLLNLVVNAKDAMPNGGRIDISVGTCVLETELRLRGERLPPGRYAELVVKDTGTGMDEETLSHIFDPYFTTKGAKGHGLGLSSVSGIIAQSGGLIDVVTEPGVGTEFHIYLPAVPAAAAAAGRGLRSVVLATA